MNKSKITFGKIQLNVNKLVPIEDATTSEDPSVSGKQICIFNLNYFMIYNTIHSIV